MRQRGSEATRQRGNDKLDDRGSAAFFRILYLIVSSDSVRQAEVQGNAYATHKRAGPMLPNWMLCQALPASFKHRDARNEYVVCTCSKPTPCSDYDTFDWSTLIRSFSFARGVLVGGWGAAHLLACDCHYPRHQHQQPGVRAQGSWWC